VRPFKLRFIVPVVAVMTAVVNITLIPSPVEATVINHHHRHHGTATRPIPKRRNPHDGVPRGIMPERGKAGRRGAIPAATAGEMTYHGRGTFGGVMHSGPPRVYIVYWGSQWGKMSSNSNGDYTFSGDPDNMAPYQQEFFKGLGTNGELWSGVLTQYCDGVASGAKNCPASNASHVSYPSGGTLAGVWYDDSAAAPAAASDSQIEQEAIAAAVHFGNNSPGANADNQYVITSPTGVNPGTVFPKDCAWHADTTAMSWTGDDVAYTNMPYIPDAGSSCGLKSVNTNTGTLDGVSIVGGHEYAETLTDAYGCAGWWGAACSSDENADKCAWGANGSSLANITLATGTFAVQPTWANDASSGQGGCELSHAIISDPPLPNFGAKILVVGDSISNGMLGDYTGRERGDQNLVASNTTVQFVGHRTGTENIYDDPADLATIDGQQPPSDNYANPTDGYYNSSINSACSRGQCAHDALWGWSFNVAKGHIAADVSTYQPNYLLIELGFNDLAFLNTPSGTLGDAKALIDNARAVDPTVKVLIASVVTRAPLCGFDNLNSAIATYNSDLASAVPGWSTSRSPVQLVDISSGYNPATMTYDGLHPNGLGEYEIADAFSTALADDFGLGAVPGPPPGSVPGISLSTPATMSASTGSTGVLLQWSRVYGASGYKIFERDTTGNPSPLPAFSELPLPIPGDHWIAGWGIVGHTYQYEVASARGTTETSPSGPVTITMPASEPTADPPSSITVVPSPGTNSISLNWSQPSGNPNDSSISQYAVFWLDANAPCPVAVPSEALTSSTSFTITGLVAGHQYDLAIASVNADGMGAWGGAPAAIVGQGAPSAPTISAAPGNELTWQCMPFATGYWVYAGSQAVGQPVVWTRLPLEVPCNWNGSLSPGLYAITAANGTLESPKSNSVVLQLGPSAPAKITRSIGRMTGRPRGLNWLAWVPAWMRAEPNAPLLGPRDAPRA
jgi:hypothetical protein